ncbi:MAG: NAD-dependent epimerase/dehydratase family protein [Nitrospirae bacterium]|nr:NAD-dependent epimerase/dehydratase family protein [Nitrospirota bacterium]
MVKGKTVLITGAAGFLGQALSRSCLFSDCNVIGLDRVPEDKSIAFRAFYQANLCNVDLQPILSRWQPDYLINMAGNANVGKSLSDPADDFMSGPQLFFNLLEAVRKYSPKTRVLLASSAAVYGQPEALPTNENMPVRPLSPYGYHKWICESLAMEYNRIYGIRTEIIRIFSAYGAGLSKQIVWDVCCKCRDGGDILLSGTGDEARDFIHKDDICAAILLLLEKGSFECEILNVASGNKTSIRSLAEIILRSYGIEVNKLIFSSNQRKGDPAVWQADISRLKSLGFRQSVNLEAGIAGCVSWFKEIHLK